MSDIQCAVTLFSLAHPYLHRKLDLQGCLEFVSSCGYEGIELVSAQMVKGYPEPDEAWIADFRNMMDRYGLEGYAYGCYVDKVRYTGRTRSADEDYYAALQDMKTAKALGFKSVKTAASLDDETIIRLIPIAKSLGLWFGFELHDPERCNDERWKRLFDIFDQYGPDTVGVVPDMGMFAARPNKLFLNGLRLRGIEEERLQQMVKLHADGLDLETAAGEMGTVTEQEKAALGSLYRTYHPYPFSDLTYTIPYSRYMHGKCFYINENYEDESVDYKEVMRVLKEGGFKGPLACEYEGYFTEAEEDSVEQVRRYAKMFERLR